MAGRLRRTETDSGIVHPSPPEKIKLANTVDSLADFGGHLQTLADSDEHVIFTVEEEVDKSIPFWIFSSRERPKVSQQVCIGKRYIGEFIFTYYSSFVPDSSYNNDFVSQSLYELCSSYELLHREFEHLKVMIMNNGYQRDFIYYLIEEFT